MNAATTARTVSVSSPTLSVVVPAFNEERLLDSSVRSLHQALEGCGVRAEIIVVDDGSVDRTGAIANRLAETLPRVRVHHQGNQGIGGAFQTGAASAAGEYIMLWPADMAATASDLMPFVENFGVADVIVGCRSRRVGYNPLMRLNAWIYPKLVSLLFGLRIRDINWIHAYRRSSYLSIRLSQRGIPMLAEALVRLRDEGAKIVEVKAEMKPRKAGTAAASRFRVMRQTILGLAVFWRGWRRGR